MGVQEEQGRGGGGGGGGEGVVHQPSSQKAFWLEGGRIFSRPCVVVLSFWVDIYPRHGGIQ